MELLPRQPQRSVPQLRQLVAYLARLVSLSSSFIHVNFAFIVSYHLKTNMILFTAPAFGAPQPAPAFGAPAPAFGAPAPATGGLFGAPGKSLLLK